jgi:hypothetical protein
VIEVGRHVRHGAPAIDAGDPLGDVLIRQQHIEANVHKARVAVVVFPIRESAFENFDQQMDVGACASIGPWHHGPQVITWKSRQRVITGSS